MSTITGTRVHANPQAVDLIQIASGKSTGSRVDKANGFGAVLKQELASSQGVTFSKHAQARMHSRNISLTPSQESDLANAIDRAATKGSRETLVLADSAAFVVSVAHRTVITVFDKEHLRDGVVSSIDSAVIL